MISLRAFDEFYNVIPDKVIYGYRFNKIKAHFARLLRSLKYGGAELIFVSKNAPNIKEIHLNVMKDSFKRSNQTLEIIKNMEDPVLVSFFSPFLIICSNNYF